MCVRKERRGKRKDGEELKFPLPAQTRPPPFPQYGIRQNSKLFLSFKCETSESLVKFLRKSGQDSPIFFVRFFFLSEVGGGK